MHPADVSRLPQRRALSYGELTTNSYQDVVFVGFPFPRSSCPPLFVASFPRAYILACAEQTLYALHLLSLIHGLLDAPHLDCCPSPSVGALGHKQKLWEAARKGDERKALQAVKQGAWSNHISTDKPLQMGALHLAALGGHSSEYQNTPPCPCLVSRSSTHLLCSSVTSRTSRPVYPVATIISHVGTWSCVIIRVIPS
jgi:hypothetical protein